LALREFIGEYGDVSPLLRHRSLEYKEIKKYLEGIRKNNPRVSLLQPLVAEGLAFGATVQQSEEVLGVYRSVTLSAPWRSLRKRAEWIQHAMSQNG
jgi:hypothetical protein